MLSGIWALFKGLAISIGWMKQDSDQDTGRALQNADGQKVLIDETQAVHDARDNPAVVDSVRSRSSRD